MQRLSAMRQHRVCTRARLSSVPVALVVALALAGCASSTTASTTTTAKQTWAQTLAAARGQTVNWWMYGGDAATNAFADHYVTPAASELGVRVHRVPITETTEAFDRVVAEHKAGKTTGGSVDMIWINGANFVEGKNAGLWKTGWARALPNSRYVNWDAPIISRDFQVPVDDQESPWEGAAFVYGYNTAQVSSPPTSFPALLAWAKAHPGRFAYPAPPDFTGAAFVRQVIQRLGGVGQGLAYLEDLKPYQFQHGATYPTSIDELDQLFANGQVSFDMSYNANFLDLGVKSNKFPRTVRPFLIGGGALENTSYVTIPANAAHTAGAEVVANLLLSPKLQADLVNPGILGMPSVLAPSLLPAASAAQLKSSAQKDPYLLLSLGTPLTELAAGEDEPIEKVWKQMVLR